MLVIIHRGQIQKFFENLLAQLRNNLSSDPTDAITRQKSGKTTYQEKSNDQQRDIDHHFCVALCKRAVHQWLHHARHAGFRQAIHCHADNRGNKHRRVLPGVRKQPLVNGHTLILRSASIHHMGSSDRVIPQCA